MTFTWHEQCLLVNAQHMSQYSVINLKTSFYISHIITFNNWKFTFSTVSFAALLSTWYIFFLHMDQTWSYQLRLLSPHRILWYINACIILYIGNIFSKKALGTSVWYLLKKSCCIWKFGWVTFSLDSEQGTAIQWMVLIQHLVNHEADFKVNLLPDR